MQQVDAIKLAHFKSVRDISVADWTLQGEPYNPFHELGFLSVLENSKVENAIYDYLVFYKDKKAIATAVLSSFEINLSLFIGEAFWVKWLKRIFPDLFHVKILFCGTPVSIGHSNFHCIDQLEACLTLLNHKMKKLAKQRKIRLLTFKEIPESTVQDYSLVLKNSGWFTGYSIPDTKMHIRWDAYDSYLLSMKSRYRRQILAAITSLNNGEKPALTDCERLLQEHIKIVSAEEIEASDFYAKYLSVMGRAAVKLETLNPAFFDFLQNNYKDTLRYFVGHSTDGEYCYALCYENKDNLHFLWTAKACEKDAANTYLNQLQAMICYAIKKKIKHLHIGQTAYYPKMRLGAIPEERLLFFKSLNPVMNPILRMLRKEIFPRLSLQTIQPFKNEERSNG